MSDDKPIAFMFPVQTQTNNRTEVRCPDCAAKHPHPHQGSKLWRINVGDYKQTCHVCRKELVMGKTRVWCELYPPPGYMS